MTALDAHLTVARGGFRLDLPLTAAAGEVIALLGPNGSGKTTAVRALAGLLPLDAGHVSLAGRRLDDPGGGVFVPARHRSIGLVFQDYLLFPHLSALDNVAFGPRFRGVPRAAARATARDWLDRVGLADRAAQRPRRLSGGQAQRVALARALAPAPDLLLLDEPLAALDARTRLETRSHLRRHLAAHPGVALLVTHDPVDAMVLADRLVIIEDGRAVQAGDAATITARPRTDYVARLVGLNLYQGSLDPSGREPATVMLDGGFVLATTSAETPAVAPGPDGPPGPADAPGPAEGAPGSIAGRVFVAFPPSAVALHPERPTGSPRNVWPATVAGVDRHGDYLRVALTGPIAASADVTPAAAAQLGLEPGRTVWAAVKATETRVYPA